MWGGDKAQHDHTGNKTEHTHARAPDLCTSLISRPAGLLRTFALFLTFSFLSFEAAVMCASGCGGRSCTTGASPRSSSSSGSGSGSGKTGSTQRRCFVFGFVQVISLAFVGPASAHSCDRARSRLARKFLNAELYSKVQASLGVGAGVPSLRVDGNGLCAAPKPCACAAYTPHAHTCAGGGERVCSAADMPLLEGS